MRAIRVCVATVGIMRRGVASEPDRHGVATATADCGSVTQCDQEAKNEERSDTHLREG